MPPALNIGTPIDSLPITDRRHQNGLDDAFKGMDRDHVMNACLQTSCRVSRQHETIERQGQPCFAETKHGFHQTGVKKTRPVL